MGDEERRNRMFYVWTGCGLLVAIGALFQNLARDQRNVFSNIGLVIGVLSLGAIILGIALEVRRRRER